MIQVTLIKLMKGLSLSMTKEVLRIYRSPWSNSLDSTIQYRVLDLYLKTHLSRLDVIHEDESFMKQGTTRIGNYPRRNLVIAGNVQSKPVHFLSIQEQIAGIGGFEISNSEDYSQEFSIAQLFRSNTFRNHFSAHFIGCLDSDTQKFLKKCNIQAKVTGSATLLLGDIDSRLLPKCNSVDISFFNLSELETYFQKYDCRKTVRFLTTSTQIIFGESEKMKMADELLGKILSSRMVVTRNIHVAFAAKSVGIRTIMVCDNPIVGAKWKEVFEVMTQEQVLQRINGDQLEIEENISLEAQLSSMKINFLNLIQQIRSNQHIEVSFIQGLPYINAVVSEVIDSINSEFRDFRHNANERERYAAQELANIRQSTSWKVTSPIRTFWELRNSHLSKRNQQER